MMTEPVWCPGDQITVHELHAVLKLRIDVFVVEQECAYPEIDGRDLAPTTLHGFVLDDDGEVVANVRLLRDERPARIGRVATRADHRGAALAERLLEAAHVRAGPEGSVLDAQTYLVAWYERLGWVVSGVEFIEDGIPHTPMERP